MVASRKSPRKQKTLQIGQTEKICLPTKRNWEKPISIGSVTRVSKNSYTWRVSNEYNRFLRCSKTQGKANSYSDAVTVLHAISKNRYTHYTYSSRPKAFVKHETVTGRMSSRTPEPWPIYSGNPFGGESLLAQSLFDSMRRAVRMAARSHGGPKEAEHDGPTIDGEIVADYTKIEQHIADSYENLVGPKGDNCPYCAAGNEAKPLKHVFVKPEWPYNPPPRVDIPIVIVEADI